MSVAYLGANGVGRARCDVRCIGYPLCRAAVRGLVEEYLPLPIPSFATYLALSLFPGEGGTAGEFSAFRNQIKRDLRYLHLPQLADIGVITYDPDTADGIIDAEAAFETAVALVDMVDG